MQSMIYNARWMWRFERVETEQEDGSCVAEFRKNGKYLVSVRPTSKTLSGTETGDVSTQIHRAWVNDTHVFKPGDRLGETEQEYAVAVVVDNLTGQSMEVTRL